MRLWRVHSSHLEPLRQQGYGVHQFECLELRLLIFGDSQGSFGVRTLPFPWEGLHRLQYYSAIWDSQEP